MAPLCLLYFVMVGTWLGAAGLLLERALPASAPRRWIWCLTIPSSIALPMILSARHSSHVIGLWGLELLRMPSTPALEGSAAGSTLNNWLDCGGAYGSTVFRVWLAGSILVLAWGIASAWRLRRLVRAPRSGAAPSTVVDGVRVTITDSLGPATAGLWRPRVLLPRWALALPARRRRYVVRHEEEHRRAHDAALLAGASVLVALMPWNVPLWWHLRRLQLAVEMDCDQRVVAALGDASDYGALLLDVAEAASRGPRLQPALLGGGGMLEQRLLALVGSRSRSVAARIAAPLAAIALVAVVLSVPHPAPARDSAAPTAATAPRDALAPQAGEAARRSTNEHRHVP